MYDEIVKRMRCQLYGNCPACVNWYVEEVEPNLWRERCVAIDAAEAIEELSAAVAGFEAETDVEFVKENGRERIRFVPKWIPVKERLPEKDGKYLTAFKDGCVTDNFFMAPTGEKFKEVHPNGKWYWNETDRGGITHWMPLPTPPKEEAE